MLGNALKIKSQSCDERRDWPRKYPHKCLAIQKGGRIESDSSNAMEDKEKRK